MDERQQSAKTGINVRTWFRFLFCDQIDTAKSEMKAKMSHKQVMILLHSEAFLTLVHNK